MNKEKCFKREMVLCSIVIVFFVVIVLTVGCSLTRKQKDKDVEEFFKVCFTSDEADDYGLTSLSDHDTQRLIKAVADVLGKLPNSGQGAGFDRVEILSELQSSISALQTSLSMEQIKMISDRLLDRYLVNQSTDYVSTKDVDSNIKTAEDTIVSEMTESLQKISGYLFQMDATVVNNKKQLILLSQTQEQNLQQMHKYIMELDKMIENVQVQLSQDDVKQNIADISMKLKNIDLQIQQTDKNISSLLEEAKSKDEIHHMNTQKKFTEIEEDIFNLDKHLTEISKSLNNALFDMENKRTIDQTELLENLKNTKDYFDKAAKDNMEALKMLLESLLVINSQQYDEIKVQIDTEVLRMLEKMDYVHEQIVTTENDINKILKSVSSDTFLKIEEVNASIQIVNEALERIHANMNEAHEELTGLILRLDTTVSSNNEQLLTILDDMEKDMQIQTGENMEQIITSFSELTNFFTTETEKLQKLVNDMESNVGDQISSLNSNIDDQYAEMNSNLDNSFKEYQTWGENQFGTVNQTLVQHFSDVSDLMREGNSKLQTYLESMRSDIEGDLQSVFTSVSNGKSLLASALLTKGITISEDAKFQVIQDAILRIPQKLVIGVEELPGEVEYEYHYHADASGNNPHVATTTEQGGCYTLPRYHSHSSGCYRTEYYHEHTSSCPKKPIYVDWVDPPYWGSSYKCGDQPDNSSRSVLTCSKGSGTIDCYAPSCGLSDGQIVAAHIVYNQANKIHTDAFFSSETFQAIEMDDNIKETTTDIYETMESEFETIEPTGEETETVIEPSTEESESFTEPPTEESESFTETPAEETESVSESIVEETESVTGPSVDKDEETDVHVIHMDDNVTE